MSESIALLFKPAAPPLAVVAPLLVSFTRVDLQAGEDHEPQIVVFDGGDHAFIQSYDQQELAVELLAEGWPAELVPERVSALVVHYRTAALAKRIVLTLGGQCRFLVDTGRREIYTGAAFARRLERNPDWDWALVPAGAAPLTSRPLVVFLDGWSDPPPATAVGG